MTTLTPNRKIIGLSAPAIPARTGKIASMDEVRARLMQSLPRTLEFSDLLQIFADEVSVLVEFDALNFSRDDGAASFATAPHARHRASYRLEITGVYLGDIVFSRGRIFDNGELIRLESALACIGFPLRNALLYREALNAARIDALTQVGNRAALNQAMSTELQLADRHHLQLAVLMIDIDHFKHVNDRNGHQIGDEVLKSVAGILANVVRKSDAVYRFGGEEFVVLLRNTDVTGAAIIAERLRQAIECAPVRGSEGTIPVTISSGIAQYEHGQSATALLERADKALYQAKQDGRNRVCIAA